MPTNNVLAKALTPLLRNAFSAAQITEWADALSQIQTAGLKIDDVFPQGMPVQDTLMLKTAVPLNELGATILKIQQHLPIRRIDISPVGVPVQDMWRMRISLGSK
jgi:hypothetical protein